MTLSVYWTQCFYLFICLFVCVLYAIDILPVVEPLERNSAEEKLLEDFGSYDEVVNLHLAFTFNIM